LAGQVGNSKEWRRNGDLRRAGEHGFSLALIRIIGSDPKV
jgi:hypothetical protein